MRYRSKVVEVEAHQWQGTKEGAPDWFMVGLEVEVLQVGEGCVCVRNDYGASDYQVPVGGWVVMQVVDEERVAFVGMEDQTFRLQFEAARIIIPATIGKFDGLEIWPHTGLSPEKTAHRRQQHGSLQRLEPPPDAEVLVRVTRSRTEAPQEVAETPSLILLN